MTEQNTTSSHPTTETVTKEWRCFFCDEVFTTEPEARAHFGSYQSSEPVCVLKMPGEYAIVQVLRNMEGELARYRADDSDVLRAMWSMSADHQAALRREEEKGYARGIRDLGSLRDHVNAMCGWAELLAEERQWTRENANSFWTSYDAAREVARER